MEWRARDYCECFQVARIILLGRRDSGFGNRTSSLREFFVGQSSCAMFPVVTAVGNKTLVTLFCR